MLAECRGDDVILLELVARFVEVVREVVDTKATLLAVTHFPDVLVHWLAVVRLRANAVQPSRQHHCKGKIRIGRRIRNAMFHTSAKPASFRNAEHRRGVWHTPSNISGA